MRVFGILLVVVSIGLFVFAWAGPLPGARTVERVRDKETGVWKTVKDIDESRPLRWTIAGSAVVVFLLGGGLVAYSLRAAGAKPTKPAVAKKPSRPVKKA